ncbi:MAG: UDP-N-acetylmuramoyl-L-alanine--D-glutamate ligase [Bacteroidales bacterium]
MSKRIVILGGGESGVGAAILAKVKGFDVFLSDKGAIADKYQKQLDKYEIAWEQKQHTMELIISADELIKSPGIPDNVEIIQKAKSKSIPIISEIEFAGRHTDAKMICITGSNGKTTTTMLTYHILKSAGLNVGLAGNVGYSLAYQVATKDYDYYVIELSSFQLDNMYSFKANVAVLMNITPDHLDRYDYKMDNYVSAKFRILRNQSEDDAFIYWQGDPIIAAQLKSLNIESRAFPFGVAHHDDTVAYLDGENVIIDYAANELIIPQNRLGLQGLHNMYNSMAAGLSASLLNIKKDDIRKALEDFEAVEHRLEYVATKGGVIYINDSKATNVNSCWYALESAKTPTVLILGGKDKGNDYAEIEELVKQKVHTIICMGVDNSKLLKFFDGKVSNLIDAHSVEDAVKMSAKYANEGDTVLLSPCCASFDLFSSYEDRGRQFKEQVKNLNS